MGAWGVYPWLTRESWFFGSSRVCCWRVVGFDQQQKMGSILHLLGHPLRHSRRLNPAYQAKSINNNITAHCLGWVGAVTCNARHTCAVPGLALCLSHACWHPRSF